MLDMERIVGKQESNLVGTRCRGWGGQDKSDGGLGHGVDGLGCQTGRSVLHFEHQEDLCTQ